MRLDLDGAEDNGDAVRYVQALKDIAVGRCLYEIE